MHLRTALRREKGHACGEKDQNLAPEIIPGCIIVHEHTDGQVKTSYFPVHQLASSKNHIQDLRWYRVATDCAIKTNIFQIALLLQLSNKKKKYFLYAVSVQQPIEIIEHVLSF